MATKPRISSSLIFRSSAGIAAASVLWFTTLGFGARALAPYAARPRVWQIVDIAIGIVMVLIALRLIIGH